MSRGRLLVLLGAFLNSAVDAQVRIFQLSGACDEKDFLNSLTFRMRGRTNSGAPYYKADGVDEYLYYDPDCSGGHDGTGRWILDNDAPSLTADEDLDRDGVCDYHARLDWPYAQCRDGPPMTAHWFINCGSKGWQDRFMTLIEVTSTSTGTTTSTRTTTVTSTSTATRTSSTATTSSTVTTTSSTNTFTGTSSTATTTSVTFTTRTWTATTVSVTNTETHTQTETEVVTSTEKATSKGANSTTEAPELPGSYPKKLRLSGACHFKDFLNGLVFDLIGSTPLGSPLYKAEDAKQYIYYDVDCYGNGKGTPRWIIDENMADNFTLTKDLDQDGACNYHARVYSEDAYEVPENTTWKMYCGDGWEELRLSIEIVPEEVEEKAPRALLLGLKGNCSRMEVAAGSVLLLEGTTASGAPFYSGHDKLGRSLYIYHDPSCDGFKSRPAPRWILDADRPDVERANDLDEDHKCEYYGAVDDENITRPPESAHWKMRCGATWKDVLVSLEAVPLPNSTTRTTTAVTTNVLHHAFLSAAPGRGPLGALSAALLLSLASVLAA